MRTIYFLLFISVVTLISCSTKQTNQEVILPYVHKVIEPQEVSESKPPIIFLLHGYGSNYDDLLFLKNVINPEFLIVSVQAPITLSQESYGWFDLEFHNGRVSSVDTFLAMACTYNLNIFIDSSVAKFNADSNKIFILGFSQGASLALDLYLNTHGNKYSIACLSGMLNSNESYNLPECNRPIFVGHGVYDTVIPISSAHRIKDIVSPCENLTYKEYKMSHKIIEEELKDLAVWFNNSLQN